MDLNASSNHKFSCVESEVEELIRAFKQSRMRLCLSGVQVLGAIVENANAHIASARVVDSNVNGLKARDFTGASISRSSCSCSFGKIASRCSASASTALPS